MSVYPVSQYGIPYTINADGTKKYTVAMPMGGTRDRPGPMVMVDMDEQGFSDYMLEKERGSAIGCSILSLFWGNILCCIPALIFACRPVDHPRGRYNYICAQKLILAGVLMAVFILIPLILLLALPDSPLHTAIFGSGNAKPLSTTVAPTSG